MRLLPFQVPREKSVELVDKRKIGHEKKPNRCRGFSELSTDDGLSTGGFGRFGPRLGSVAEFANLHLQIRRLKILEANQRLVNHPHRPFGLTEISEHAKGRG